MAEAQDAIGRYFAGLIEKGASCVRERRRSAGSPPISARTASCTEQPPAA